jgi:uncharacterized membrane protein YozB (DUF420 family)
MIELFQIHASLQVLTVVLLLIGVNRARKHNVKVHHYFIFSALTSMTLAVAIMIYQSRGLSTFQGKLGFSVYLIILVTISSGKLFLDRKITRNYHRSIAIIGISLLLFMILNGLFTFVF